MIVRPTPEQRAEMAAYIDATQPGLLEDLGISRGPVCIDCGCPAPRRYDHHKTCDCSTCDVPG